MNCRICNSQKITLIEEVQFYDDYKTSVYDCMNCGSRFSESRPDLFEQLHASSMHYYVKRMEDWTEKAKYHFDRRNVANLFRATKDFHFAMPHIIKTIESSRSKSVLEVGCAWGYNGAFFILKKYSYLGVDISQTAIEYARRFFGDYFLTVFDSRFKDHELFDSIFHLGTIGCVEKPIEFTYQLLGKLRPGGVLIFNAPTRKQCDQLGTTWINGACPPDLVTLFDDQIWSKEFSNMAQVRIKSHWISSIDSFRIKLNSKEKSQIARGKILEPRIIKKSLNQGLLRPYFRRIKKSFKVPFVEPIANPFGVIVTMVKK